MMLMLIVQTYIKVFFSCIGTISFFALICSQQRRKDIERYEYKQKNLYRYPSEQKPNVLLLFYIFQRIIDKANIERGDNNHE